MNWRTISKLAGLGAGAFIGGPACAFLGAAIGAATPELLARAAEFLADKDTGQTVGSIFANLFSGDLAEAAKTKELAGFNHDFRKAMAMALVKCLAGDAKNPGPVQKRLFEADPYGVLSQDNKERLKDIVSNWRDHIEEAIRKLPVTGGLEALFPPGAMDSDYLKLVDEAPSDSSKSNELLLTGAFYDQAFAPSLANAGLEHLPGGAETLKKEVVAALLKEFSGQFAEVIKSPEFKRSWIAFQKTVLLANRRALETLDASVDGIRKQLEELSGPQWLAQVADVVAARISGDSQAIAAIDSRTKELLGLVRAQSAPPLFLPERSDGDIVAGGLDRLRFENRWIPSIGREAETESLNGFLDGPGRFRWWGIVGDGGTGKSRLGLEYADEAALQGWTVGFLKPNEGWLSPKTTGPSVWQPTGPTLVIIDYAAKHGADLVSALARLADRESELIHPVRILLLDRPGAVSPLFAEVAQRSAQVGLHQDFSRAHAALHRPSTNLPPEPIADGAPRSIDPKPAVREEDLLRLGPLARGNWPAIIQSILWKAGDTRPMPPESDTDFWDTIRRLTSNGSPLLLQAVAEAISRRSQDPKTPFVLNTENRDALLDEILEREFEDRWTLVLPPEIRASQTSRDTSLLQLKKAVALVTLSRGAVLPDAAQTLQQFAGVPDEHLETFLSWLEEILHFDPDRGGKRRLRPLAPDLFGERLLVTLAAASARTGKPVIDRSDLLAGSMKLDGPGTIQTLALVANDYPKEVLPWLVAFFEQLPANACIAEDADVAMSTSSIPAAIQALVPAAESGVDFTATGIRGALASLANQSQGNRFAVLLGLQLMSEQIAQNAAALVWLEELVDPLVFDLSRNESGSRSYGLLLAKIAVNAMSRYGVVQRQTELEVWGARLVSVAAAFPADPAVQLQLALGAINALRHYQSPQGLIQATHWIPRLRSSLESATRNVLPPDQQLIVFKVCLSTLYILDLSENEQLMALVRGWTTSFAVEPYVERALRHFRDPLDGLSFERQKRFRPTLFARLREERERLKKGRAP